MRFIARRRESTRDPWKSVTRMSTAHRDIVALFERFSSNSNGNLKGIVFQWENGAETQWTRR